MDFQAWRLVAASIALRITLLLLGSVDILQWRIEVSTPANSLQSVREGLYLDDLGISPYAGSQCRTQPLTLWLSRWTAQSVHLYAVPNILLDVVAGLTLRKVAQCLSSGRLVSQYMPSNTVMAIYLLNPFTIASCVAGVVTPLENTACIMSLLAAINRRWFETAALLAFATYMDLHCLLLVVPAALLLLYGPEAIAHTDDIEQSVKLINNTHQEGQPTAQTAGCFDTVRNDMQQTSGREASVCKPFIASKHVVPACLCLFVMVILFSLGLVLISDILVHKHKSAGCLVPKLSQIVFNQLTNTVAPSMSTGGGSQCMSRDSTCASLDDTAANQPMRCWAEAVYGLHVLVEDQTPNIGQSWYFFTEMFAAYLPFFRFVIHSLSVVLVVPMAIRFPRRPILLFILQCIINCMFKPYPSVADHALYLGLLPLLGPQLAILKTGMLLVVSYLLLAVLEHSMWHQWINIESANSNFYYSISLLVGAWQTFLVVQLLLLTVKMDRGKKYKAVNVTQCKPSQTCIIRDT